jgi:hypothetical protein
MHAEPLKEVMRTASSVFLDDFWVSRRLYLFDELCRQGPVRWI